MAVDPIETMVPGLPGQKVNGNSSPAVGPIETMVPGLPGQKVNGNSGPAVDPIETIVFPGLPCLLYTSPSPRDRQKSRMPSSA